MSIAITAYTVFIASPGGLSKERKAFRDTLTRYNEAEAIHSRMMFIPRGWEDTLGGVGRPQSLINEDIRRCDYFILLLADRWGSAPDREGKYTSGTEEEFELALQCLADPGLPMRQVVIFFKAVGRKQLSDPGLQLTRVLEFKKQLEVEKQHLYHNFDTVHGFENLVRNHLGSWVRESTSPDEVVNGTLPHIREAVEERSIRAVKDESGGGGVSSSDEMNSLLRQAAKLAADGQRTDAEALLARVTVHSEDPSAFMQYGWFLRTDGRYKQALTMFETAMRLADASRNPAAVAEAQQAVAIVFRVQGDIARAERMLRSVLKTYEQLDDLEGVANSYGNLGGILFTRRDLDGAEDMYKRALEICERLGLTRGIGLANSDLGNVLLARGELDLAEANYRRGLEVFEGLGHLEGIAQMYDALGTVLENRDDLTGAKSMHLQSLELAEKIGDQEGIARACGNLGNVYYRLEEYDSAEEMHRRSLAIEEKIGHLVGMAADYVNLGRVLSARHDFQEAEAAYRKSLELSERVGDPEGIAAAYSNLGVMFWLMGNDADGTEMIHAAAARYRSYGAENLASGIEDALHQFRELSISDTDEPCT